MSRLVVYTDGACKSAMRPAVFNGNSKFPGQVATPGNEPLGMGGWAWWVHDHFWDSGAVHETTNNRMELLAVIQAIRSMLSHVPDRTLLIVSDSSYVVNCFADRWMDKWRTHGEDPADWRNSSGKPVKNADYWKTLIDLYETHPTAIMFRHCRGHGRGGPGDAPYVAGNAKADKLAVAARKTLE